MSWQADITVWEILKAVGLVEKRRHKRPYEPDEQRFELGDRNNEMWSVDYKGQYEGKGWCWCYRLTLTDNDSRYLLGCHGVSETDYEQEKRV